MAKSKQAERPGRKDIWSSSSDTQKPGYKQNYVGTARELVNGPAKMAMPRRVVEDSLVIDEMEVSKLEEPKGVPVMPQKTLENDPLLVVEPLDDPMRERKPDHRDLTPFYEETADVKSKTVIAEDVEINGDIRAKGNVDIFGTVMGNVESEGHVKLTGTVTGNIAANSIALVRGQINGEYVQAKTHISLEKDIAVVGQIEAQSVIMNGKVKGNVTVTDNITLNEHAIVEGMITSKTVSIQRGAQIIGAMQVRSDEEE